MNVRTPLGFAYLFILIEVTITNSTKPLQLDVD